jgi:hypothetical protein
MHRWVHIPSKIFGGLTAQLLCLWEWTRHIPFLFNTGKLRKMMNLFIKQVQAQKSFKISDDFTIRGIEEVSEEVDSVPDQLELWAAVDLKFSGNIPDSYRVLNAIIGDWVEAHEEQLDKAVHPVLIKFFEDYYPDSDLSEIREKFENTPIMTDQADYMPRTEEGSSTLTIEVELIVEPEALDK